MLNAEQLAQLMKDLVAQKTAAAPLSDKADAMFEALAEAIVAHVVAHAEVYGSVDLATGVLDSASTGVR
jgi:hypothetical protein